MEGRGSSCSKVSGLLSTEIKCEHPGPLANGWIENIEHGTALGSSIIYRCFANTTIEGDQSAVCENNGTWSRPSPKCMGKIYQ